MNGFKRWLGALVAVLFLATAALHVFTHVGAVDFDASCAMCHVQQAGAVAVPAPAVAVAPVLGAAVADLAAPAVRAASAAAVPARAPPSVRA